MNVLYQSDEVSTQKTNAVSGSLEPIDALRRMLAGSGLGYQFQEPNSVLVSAESRNPRTDEEMCQGSCRTTRSAGAESGSTVTVRGMLVDAAFDPGQVAVVDSYLTLTPRDFAAGGFQTVGDVLRSLPQNFGGGLNVGVFFAGGNQTTTSLSAASSVNLRGLGSGSTLVLINGERVASAESSGAVDVSLIPIAAVERIEITTGSASALYGSDAVAGVVNIVIRTDYQGVELSVARGIATEHGNSLQHYSAVAGGTVEGVKLFGALDCVWQREIESQQREYIPADITGTSLMPGLQRCSTLGSAAGRLSHSLEGSVFGAYTTRSVYQTKGLALGSTVFTTLADVHQYAVNGILKQHFLRSWTVTLSAGLSTDDVSSETVLTQGGVSSQPEAGLLDNRLWTAQIIASGTVAETRAGAALVTFGGGYNQQSFLFANLSGGDSPLARQRGVSFAFVESEIPLLASGMDVIDPTALSLDAAVRTERYSQVGRTTNWKFALTYKPIPSVKVQASWGTSFRAPSLLQQFNASQAALEVVPDPTSSSGQSLALLRFGGNPLLEPERSSDAALDLTYNPEAVAGMLFRIGYFSISYHQRIDYPTLNTGNPLSDPNVWPFVTRNPSSAAITQILAQSQFTDLTAGQFAAQQASAVIDDRNQNFVRQRASGVDFLEKYDWDTPSGRWDSSLNVAYLDLKQQLTNEAVLTQLSGAANYPPVWRGRLGVNWSTDGYLASFFVNYTGRSREIRFPGQPATVIQPALGSWTTVDGQVGMVFNRGSRWGSSRLTLSAQNLLDRRPPLIRNDEVSPGSINYDSTNASPVGRFLTLQLMQVW